MEEVRPAYLEGTWCGERKRWGAKDHEGFPLWCHPTANRPRQEQDYPDPRPQPALPGTLRPAYAVEPYKTRVSHMAISKVSSITSASTQCLPVFHMLHVITCTSCMVQSCSRSRRAVRRRKRCTRVHSNVSHEHGINRNWLRLTCSRPNQSGSTRDKENPG